MEALYFDSKSNIPKMFTSLQKMYPKYNWRICDGDIRGTLDSGLTVFNITIRPCEWDGYRMRVCGYMVSDESAFQAFFKEAKQIVAMLTRL